MTAKQNLFCALMMVACLPLAPVAWADDPASTVNIGFKAPGPVEPAPSAKGQLSLWFDHIRKRDRDPAFAMLTTAAQSTWGQDARVFMNTLRLDHPILYGHQRVIVTPISGDANHPSHQTFRVELFKGDNKVSLAIIRLVRGPRDQWQIDRLTILPDAPDREA